MAAFIIELIKILLKKLVPVFLKKPKQASSEYNDALTKAALVYSLLSEVKSRIPTALRSFVVYTHNGGGIPTVFSPIYSSILFEERHVDCPSIRSLWQNKLADSAYIRVLGDIISKKSLVLTVGDDTYRHPCSEGKLATPGGVGGIMADVYLQITIAEVYVAYIGSRAGRQYYMGTHVSEVASEEEKAIYSGYLRLLSDQIKEVLCE